MYVDVYKLEDIADGDNIIYRLHLKHIDEELIFMLMLLDKNFEIIYELDKFDEDALKLLSEYKKLSKRKVSIQYNIENKSLFERSMLIYYMNLFGLNVVLVGNNKEESVEWKNEIKKYSDNKVRLLHKSVNDVVNR